jgi:protein-S-isoprenylcysteine O-methyltransferase Ste14
MKIKENTLKNSKLKSIFRFLLLFVFIGLLFFLPAGSLNYLEAWIYCIILFIPMSIAFIYFLRMDSGLLKRRGNTIEHEKEQKIIRFLFTFLFLIGFVIPGLDYRFNWSDVPLYIVLISDCFVLLGYLIIFLTLKENSHASSIIEVGKEQKVISSGPYKIVRHPMYSGGLLILLFTPIALGSYWALIVFILCTPSFFILRIIYEEKFLIDNLSGYKVYCQKTKYRLVPFIW